MNKEKKINEEKKVTLIFISTLVFGVSKGFEIILLFKMHGVERVNRSREKMLILPQLLINIDYVQVFPKLFYNAFKK